MRIDSKRQALVRALKNIPIDMHKHLSDSKRQGESNLDRPDFVWHILLLSFATWGGSRGYDGLMGNEENYQRVTFDSLSSLTDDERPQVLEKVFLEAKVRYATMKAGLMARNYVLVAEMGGPEEATKRAMAEKDRQSKIGSQR